MKIIPKCPPAISSYAIQRLHAYNIETPKYTYPWYVRWITGTPFKIRPLAHHCNLHEFDKCDIESLSCKGKNIGCWLGGNEQPPAMPYPDQKSFPNEEAEISYNPKYITILFSFSSDFKKCVIMDIDPDGNLNRILYEFQGERDTGLLGRILKKIEHEKIDPASIQFN